MPLFSIKSFSGLSGITVIAMLTGLTAVAEVRTLTDQMGRSIKADVIAVDGDIVKIRREDGQLFDMPLAKLSEEDQATLKAQSQTTPKAAESSKAAPVPGSVAMSVSRGKFNVDVTYKSEYSKDSYEDWGYNVQLTNTTLQPIEGLRVEYNIFGRLFASSSQRVESGRRQVEALGPKKGTTFRTKSFRLNKWKSLGSNGFSGELTGIWARLYIGDTLVQEYASPESVKAKETWTPPKD